MATDAYFKDKDTMVNKKESTETNENFLSPSKFTKPITVA